MIVDLIRRVFSSEGTERSRPLPVLALAAFLGTTALVAPAAAQMPNAGPPAVGIIVAAKMPITQTQQFIGRVEAINRVNIVARVTAQLQETPFTEGREVKKGEVLFRLEQPPYQAALDVNKALITQYEAQLRNATSTTERAQALLKTPAGQQSTVDAAVANQQALEAQILGAKAQLRTSQINLDYTTITSPIDGKIGRYAVTTGNIVGPNTGTLATIVSQDPMYVTFPVPSPQFLDLSKYYGSRGGFAAVRIKLKLPDGSTYDQEGKLNYVDPTIANGTDTVTLRGEITNPTVAGAKPGEINRRPLIDGEFVTVLLEGVEPIQVLAIPRGAVLTDQQGSYVYVVGKDDVAEQRRVQLGQTTPATAMVSAGLAEGEKVIVDGIQKVRPGAKVAPSPVPASPASGNGAAK